VSLVSGSRRVRPKVSESSDKALFYERFAPHFDASMNRYEVNKRLRLVFDGILGSRDLRNVSLLDAGCGTGLFSLEACRRGASVTSMDVGEGLLAMVAEKCDSTRVVGDLQALPFDDDSFQIVLCTEVIEHVQDPLGAIGELARVLRPGGTLILTTPNRIWHPAIRLAGALRLRPYEGFENWIGWRTLLRSVERSGLEIERWSGFNALPFLFPATYPLIDLLDRLGSTPLGRTMINMLVVAAKPIPQTP
jgi:SAM-dependent methyltransferase